MFVRFISYVGVRTNVCKCIQVALCVMTSRAYCRDFGTGRLEGICQGHMGEVTCSAFIKGYPLFVTTDTSGSIIVWGTRPCPPQKQYRPVLAIKAMSFRDDRRGDVSAIARIRRLFTDRARKLERSHNAQHAQHGSPLEPPPGIDSNVNTMASGGRQTSSGPHPSGLPSMQSMHFGVSSTANDEESLPDPTQVLFGDMLAGSGVDRTLSHGPPITAMTMATVPWPTSLDWRKSVTQVTGIDVTHTCMTRTADASAAAGTGQPQLPGDASTSSLPPLSSATSPTMNVSPSQSAMTSRLVLVTCDEEGRIRIWDLQAALRLIGLPSLQQMIDIAGLADGADGGALLSYLAEMNENDDPNDFRREKHILSASELMNSVTPEVLTMARSMAARRRSLAVTGTIISSGGNTSRSLNAQQSAQSNPQQAVARHGSSDGTRRRQSLSGALGVSPSAGATGGLALSGLGEGRVSTQLEHISSKAGVEETPLLMSVPSPHYGRMASGARSNHHASKNTVSGISLPGRRKSSSTSPPHHTTDASADAGSPTSPSGKHGQHGRSKSSQGGRRGLGSPTAASGSGTGTSPKLAKEAQAMMARRRRYQELMDARNPAAAARRRSIGGGVTGVRGERAHSADDHDLSFQLLADAAAAHGEQISAGPISSPLAASRRQKQQQLLAGGAASTNLVPGLGDALRAAQSRLEEVNAQVVGDEHRAAVSHMMQHPEKSRRHSLSMSDMESLMSLAHATKPQMQLSNPEEKRRLSLAQSVDPNRRPSMVGGAGINKRGSVTWNDVTNLTRALVASVDATPDIDILIQWQGHGDTIKSVQVITEHNPPTLLTAASDGTIRLWNLWTGEPLGNLVPEETLGVTVTTLGNAAERAAATEALRNRAESGGASSPVNATATLSTDPLEAKGGINVKLPWRFRIDETGLQASREAEAVSVIARIREMEEEHRLRATEKAERQRRLKQEIAAAAAGRQTPMSRPSSAFASGFANAEAAMQSHANVPVRPGLNLGSLLGAAAAKKSLLSLGPLAPHSVILQAATANDPSNAGIAKAAAGNMPGTGSGEAQVSSLVFDADDASFLMQRQETTTLLKDLVDSRIALQHGDEQKQNTEDGEQGGSGSGGDDAHTHDARYTAPGRDLNNAAPATHTGGNINDDNGSVMNLSVEEDEDQTQDDMLAAGIVETSAARKKVGQGKKSSGSGNADAGKQEQSGFATVMNALATISTGALLDSLSSERKAATLLAAHLAMTNQKPLIDKYSHLRHERSRNRLAQRSQNDDNDSQAPRVGSMSAAGHNGEQTHGQYKLKMRADGVVDTTPSAFLATKLGLRKKSGQSTQLQLQEQKRRGMLAGSQSAPVLPVYVPMSQQTDSKASDTYFPPSVMTSTNPRVDDAGVAHSIQPRPMSASNRGVSLAHVMGIPAGRADATVVYASEGGAAPDTRNINMSSDSTMQRMGASASLSQLPPLGNFNRRPSTRGGSQHGRGSTPSSTSRRASTSRGQGDRASGGAIITSKEHAALLTPEPFVMDAVLQSVHQMSSLVSSTSTPNPAGNATPSARHPNTSRDTARRSQQGGAGDGTTRQHNSNAAAITESLSANMPVGMAATATGAVPVALVNSLIMARQGGPHASVALQRSHSTAAPNMWLAADTLPGTSGTAIGVGHSLSRAAALPLLARGVSSGAHSSSQPSARLTARSGIAHRARDAHNEARELGRHLEQSYVKMNELQAEYLHLQKASKARPIDDAESSEVKIDPVVQRRQQIALTRQKTQAEEVKRAFMRCKADTLITEIDFVAKQTALHPGPALGASIGVADSHTIAGQDTRATTSPRRR
jgi:hypothetical protein